MDKYIKVEIQMADIAQFEADVVALKYAGGLSGAAGAVARVLGKTDEDIKKLLPSIGSIQLFPGRNRIKAKQAFFLRVVSLSSFDYNEVYLFSFEVLKGIARMAPETQHIAFTLQGTGFGLDTYKVFKSELDGCIDAIDKGEYPQSLNRITIVDRNEVLVKQCHSSLSELLPFGKIKSKISTGSGINSNKTPADEYQHPDDQFDVFISFKSEDINYARSVYDFLKSNHFRVFFSKESLPQMGSAEYHEQIDAAIEKARHMVVVTSKSEYVRSKWVEYEWRLFQGEKLAGRKSGNLITMITEEMNIIDLPISLRNREVIPLNPEGMKNLLGFSKKPTGREDEISASSQTVNEIANTDRKKSVRATIPDSQKKGSIDSSKFKRIAHFVLLRTEFLKNKSWMDARNHGQSLNIDGYTGWELPSIEQLKLIRKSEVFPENYCYWSSKELEGGEAQYMHFDDGHLGQGPKNFSRGVCAIFIWSPYRFKKF